MSETALSALFLQNPQLAIALRRKMEAEGLVKEGSSGDPIRSPWQGVNRLAQGLLGGYQARQADDEIKSGMERDNAEVDSFQKQMAAALMGQQGGGAAPAAPAMPAAPMSGAPSGSYADRVIGVESGGNPNARNPLSSATGAGQFIDSTWLSLMRDHPATAGKSPQEILAMRTDPALSREMVDKYAQQNATTLAGAGLPVNDATQYLAHWFGPQGATAILKAPPGTPMASVMPEGVIRANPNIASLTTDGVVGLVEQKMGAPRPQQFASLPPAATDAGGATVPRETPPAAPMAAPQAAPPQAMPGNRSALMDIYLNGISSRNPRVQKIAAGLAPFLAKEQPNLQIQNVGGQMVAINPRDGSIVRTLGPSENFTPVPQSVEEQKRRLGAPYQELPRTPERMAQEQALRPPTTLSPGQQAFGPDGRPIAAVPDRPQSVAPGNILVGADGKPIMNNPDRSKDFQQTDTLRGEYTKLTTDFRTIQDAHQKIMEASRANTGAGDMAMLYSFVKILDPTSVVRESEFATAAASGSFGERVQGAVQRVLSGQRLPDSLRKDFTDQADGIFRQQRRSYDNVRERFRELSKSFGLDPDQVTIDYVNPQAAPTAPTAAAPGQPARRDPNDPLGLLTPRPR